jgi:hypothetical protein
LYAFTPNLGVMLFVMLCGHPPHIEPRRTDKWFNLIQSGRWLDDDMRKKTVPMHSYGHLSEDVLDLMRVMMAPQHRRPTIDQVLQHRWMRS